MVRRAHPVYELGGRANRLRRGQSPLARHIPKLQSPTVARDREIKRPKITLHLPCTKRARCGSVQACYHVAASHAGGSEECRLTDALSRSISVTRFISSCVCTRDASSCSSAAHLACGGAAVAAWQRMRLKAGPELNESQT